MTERITDEPMMPLTTNVSGVCLCGQTLSKTFFSSAPGAYRPPRRDDSPDDPYAIRCAWCGRLWQVQSGAPLSDVTARQTKAPDDAYYQPTVRRYSSHLVIGSNGEEDDILYLGDGCTTPLADLIEGDIEVLGAYLSIRYYTASHPFSAEEPVEAFLVSLSGRGEAEYMMRYSEITGYLWTDEKLAVGGHDLLAELKGAAGQWVWLEITYAKTAQKEPQP